MKNDDVFACARCSSGMELDATEPALRCTRCGHTLAATNGVFDFLDHREHTAEREWYDGVYLQADGDAGPQRPIGPLEDLWTHPGWPERQEVLRRLGSIGGQRVLLLGNGQSEKELWLLRQQPELLVYSDLSPHGVGRIQREHDLSAYRDRVLFAAMDAQKLPIRDQSLDVVYGYAFVHHLPDVERFLSEVARVLRPGGRAIFMDDAYSPVWQWSKRTFLAPATAWSHARNGISPEDYRFSMTGGFREEQLSAMASRHGTTAWFERCRFLHYFWVRGAGNLLPGPLRNVAQSRMAADLVWRIDRSLCRIPSVGRQQIRLVWGLQKMALAGPATTR